MIADSDLLDEFVRVLLAWYFEDVEDDDIAKAIVRAVGYSSTNNPDFLRHLEEELSEERTETPRTEIEACGWCLRSPGVIALFGRVLVERLGKKLSGNTVWVKAFSNMLRFRKDATEAMSRTLAEKIARYLIALFKIEREKGKGNFTFRAACMCIVYLLRKRAYEHDFLDPQSELALRIKEEFRRAIQDYKRDRLELIGGSVDLPTELQRLIDYIDRKGTGLPGITE